MRLKRVRCDCCVLFHRKTPIVLLPFVEIASSAAVVARGHEAHASARRLLINQSVHERCGSMKQKKVCRKNIVAIKELSGAAVIGGSAGQDNEDERIKDRRTWSLGRMVQWVMLHLREATER